VKMSSKELVLEERRVINPQNTALMVGFGSGKGGVGKTTLAANLAITLAQLGKRVLVLDADMGLANIDILLDLKPRWNLAHLVAGLKSIDEIMVEGPCGIKVIPAGSGIEELANMDDSTREQILTLLSLLESRFDFIIVDTAGGIGRNTLAFMEASARRIVLTSPDPTSITDAYALIKLLAKRGVEEIHLFVNMARNGRVAADIADRIRLAAERFLGVDVHFLGWCEEDQLVPKAASCQEALVLKYPRSALASTIRLLATRFIGAKKTSSPFAKLLKALTRGDGDD